MNGVSISSMLALQIPIRLGGVHSLNFGSMAQAGICEAHNNLFTEQFDENGLVSGGNPSYWQGAAEGGEGSGSYPRFESSHLG